MYDKAQLLALFRERALKFGDFTLASGRKGTYYLDGKQITLHSTGLHLVAHGLLDLLGDLEFDAIGVPIPLSERYWLPLQRADGISVASSFVKKRKGMALVNLSKVP
jgi:hypothetical protein